VKNQGRFFQWLAQTADLEGEPLPGESILELSGDRRILIENYSGIREYSCECVSVHVRYGYIRICGHGLSLSRMTREQLIVRGRIDGIQIWRKS